MAKALHGTIANPSQLRLLDEIRALRQRVGELESALAEARSAASAAEKTRTPTEDHAPASV